MNKRIVAYIILIVASNSLIEAQQTPFGEEYQKLIVANYKGEWKIVVGADGDRPIVNLGDGTTKKLSSDAQINYINKEKILPIAGEITLLERVVVKPHAFSSDEKIRHATLKFIPQQSFENLYMALLHKTKDGKIIRVQISGIGKVKAGEIHRATYEFIFDRDEKRPLERFYSNGLEVRLNKDNLVVN